MSGCNAKWDEHDGYHPTGRTWTEVQGTSKITWRVYECQCGARTSDIFDHAEEIKK